MIPFSLGAAQPKGNPPPLFQHRLAHAIPRYLAVGIALILANVMAVSWFCYRNMTAAIAADTLENHTYVVMAELSGLLSSLKDAETGQRDFIITGNQSFLEHFDASLGEIEGHLTALRGLTADNSREQQRLAAMTPLIAAKLAKLKENLANRETNGFDAGRETVAEDVGRKLMEQIRALVVQAQREEEQLLQEHVVAKTADTRRTIWWVVFGGTIGSVALVLMFILLRQEFLRRERAEIELRAHEDQLTNLVDVRTQALRDSLNELQESRRAALDLAADAVAASQKAEQVSEQLREGERRMALAAESARMGLWIRDLERDEIWATDRWRALLGFEKSERLEVDSILQRLHPDDREGVREVLTRTVTDDSDYETEYRVMLPGAVVRWIASRGRVEFNDAHKPIRVRGVSIDVTERKRVETELAEKLRLQGVLASVSTLFVALPTEDVEAAIEETQRLIVETLGLDRCTLWRLSEGGGGMVCVHCWQRPGWPPLPPYFTTEGNLPWAYAKLMRAESICFTSIDQLPPEASRDAEVFRIHGPRSNLTIPLVADGRTFGALAFATLGSERAWKEDEIMDLKLIAQIIGNVVGRQQAELREGQLRSELSHALRVATLGELASALAHELNQPLAAILSNAQAARRFMDSGEIDLVEFRAILDDIVRDDKRAGNVIQNLRAMVSNRPAVRETCSLNALVDEVIDLTRSEMIEAQIEVKTALAPELPSVEAARVELQQVLVNLLINATHAMEGTPPERRIIEVSTRVEGDSVAAIVRDRGHGIPPERVSAIFAPFFSTKSSGLGMGLSICRRIIENHGGRIEARNHEDGGAAFYFTLPIPPGTALSE